MLLSQVAVDKETHEKLRNKREMILVGRVINDAKKTVSRKGNLLVKFTVKYDDDNFVYCWCAGNNNKAANIAKNLEKGDIALVCGVWEEKTYTNSSGEEKKNSELKAEFITVMDMPVFQQENSSGTETSEANQAETTTERPPWEQDDGDDYELTI